MSKISIGIIGCGNIAEKHIQSLNQLLDKVKISGLFDINNDKSVSLANKFNLKAYATLAHILNDSDLLIICTPHDAHTSILTEIDHANKYAICEKPLFINSEDESKLSLESQSKVFVISQWRFSQAFQAVKQVLGNKELGEVLFCNAVLNVNRNEDYYSNSVWRGKRDAEGGMLYNQGIHLLDAVLKLLDINPDKIKFNYFKKEKLKNLSLETEDYCNLILDNEGVPLNIEISTCFPESTQDTSIKIIGTKDVAVLSGKSANNLRYLKVKGSDILNEEENLHLKNIEAIIDHIVINKNSDLICNFQEAVGRVKFIEKIYRNPYK
jgi:UDP-N-acetyl-2-amino-2-deoxyglucuronate dehydrogenase